MVRPVKRALVIAHEPDGPAAQVEVRLRQRGIVVDTHVVTTDYDKPHDAAPFPELDGHDLLVPMGSVRSLTRLHEIEAWVHDELDMIRRAHEQAVPVLGVCFGGQLIAEAFGGRVEESPVTEIGWYEIFDGEHGPNPIGAGPWMQWHHDRFVPPPDAEVLARNETSVQLIRMGKTVGTQFHPEVDVAHVKGFLEGASDEYLDEHGVDRDLLLAEVMANEAANIAQCHAFVDWFLDDVC